MDELFSGMFDLNGDGEVEPVEVGLGGMLLDDLLSDDWEEDESADDEPETEDAGVIDLGFEDHW